MSSSDESATCWCATGAIKATAGSHPEEREATNLLSVFVEGNQGASFFRIARFNDSATHEQVLAAFDRAIDVAERLGSRY